MSVLLWLAGTLAVLCTAAAVVLWDGPARGDDRVAQRRGAGLRVGAADVGSSGQACFG